MAMKQRSTGGDPMKVLVRMIAAVALAATCGGCWGDTAQYVNRTDTITLTAGNAKDLNAATHVTDPWPPAAANTRIPGDGSRMVGAVDRYQGRQAARGPGQAGTQPGAQGGMAGSDASGMSAQPAGAAVPSSTLPY
jgi:hypothetical protein